MKYFPVLLIAFATVVSCKDKAATPAGDTAGQDSTATVDSTASFIPVADLLRDDLHKIDAYAGGILRKATVNGKKDSAFIKPAQLHQAAAAFLLPELETSAFRQSFQENSFYDQTTESLQFMYTPKDQSASSIRSLTAYMSSTAPGNNINRIYLERAWAAGDTMVQQKLTWKFGQYFYIISIKQPPKGDPITSIEKLIWDPGQFAEE